MSSGPIRVFPSPAFRAAFAATALVAVSLGGCKSSGPETTGSIGEAGNREAVSRSEAASLGERYNADPGNAGLAMRYARALRASDQTNQATAVLQQAALRNPKDTVILGAYGKSLVETGRYREAQEVLTNAHTPANPDWRILSAQGSAAAQLGDQARAQGFYEAALKIRPNEPSVLSNLGLSYALAHDLDRADQTLTLAAAQPGANARVRANLALVQVLRGRFPEAEATLRQDMSPAEAAGNVAALRKLAAKPGRLKPGPDPDQRG